MTTAKPFFRADQVGSLLRPPELITARADFQRGAITHVALRAAEDAAIRAIVQQQERIGFQVVVDGEFIQQGALGPGLLGADEDGAVVHRPALHQLGLADAEGALEDDDARLARAAAFDGGLHVLQQVLYDPQGLHTMARSLRRTPDGFSRERHAEHAHMLRRAINDRRVIQQFLPRVAANDQRPTAA